MGKKLPLAPTADLAPDDSLVDPTAAEPGVVVVFAGGEPACVRIAVVRGEMELGRELLADADADDDAVSRAHAVVAYDGRRWTVRDRGSRNGTFVDGTCVTECVCEHPPLIRLGGAILLAVADVTPFVVEVTDRLTAGPSLRAAYAEIGRAAELGRTVHLVGESGSGKELAARRFHEGSARASGPFVAVNCAAIPEGVAERLLFGAVRGAYSGADANVDGYAQAADRGTLFLDEVAELDLAVQAKLLRVLETREVLALGASRPRAIDFGLCSATHRDLRAAVAAGRFREDLYFRLGRPSVRIPPLRDRREEIPWHLARLARDSSLAMAPAFVEACMLRHWPGNVRELTAEASFAAQRALAAGRSSVSPSDLAADAGRAMTREACDAPSPEPPSPDRATIDAALLAHGGNVTASARTLGMHRNQLRRWLDKEGK
jgi:transcriptional regulator with PAS, ATPase and Fis domain